MQVCTSLQTDNHASTSLLNFFTGRMPFLPPNQQRQSTEGHLLMCSKSNSLTSSTFNSAVKCTCHTDCLKCSKDAITHELVALKDDRGHKDIIYNQQYLTLSTTDNVDTTSLSVVKWSLSVAHIYTTGLWKLRHICDIEMAIISILTDGVSTLLVDKCQDI